MVLQGPKVAQIDRLDESYPTICRTGMLPWYTKIVHQNPGVEFSFGIEVMPIRANLANYALMKILEQVEKNPGMGYNCVLRHGNIMDATALNPFTHVYQFDVG